MNGERVGSEGEIRVLYVDDDPDMTALTAELLEREDEGLSVETETKPTAGLDRLEKETFDCIVSDYQMPGMDGLEFLQSVREEWNRDVPFIIFTGKGREEVAMEALNLGADRYLQKGGDPRTQYGVLATAIRQTVERQRLATARRDAERRYRSLFENNPLVIWEEDFSDAIAYLDSIRESVEDLETYLVDNEEEIDRLIEKVHVIDVNENALDYYEAATKEELIRHLDQLFTAEAYRSLTSMWLHLAAGGTEYRMESTARTLDGEVKHEIVDVKVPAEYADEYSHVYLTVTDITAQKERQRELRELKAFNEELVEQSPVGLFRLDENLRIVYENPRAEEIIGLPDGESESEAIGTDIRELPSIVEAGIAPKFDRLPEGERITLEFEFTSLYGRESTLSGHAVPIFQDESFDGGILLLQDVSDRKERVQTLQRERDRFWTLFENFPEPTVEYVFEDGEPVIRNVNEAFVDVFGYGTDAATDTPVNDLIVPATDRDRAVEIDQRVHAGEVVDASAYRQTAEGKRRFRIRTIPLSTDDPVSGFAVYTRLSDERGEGQENERDS